MTGPVHLTRPLVIEGLDRQPDDAGGFTEVWVPRGTLWAEVVARTGREVAGAAVSLSRATFRITVRAAPQDSPARPKPGQRFRDGSRLFLIQSVTERDASGRFLTCWAEEEVVL
ncbi:head-tail adaptor protein [Roseovarius sp.]|uniref:head-tail adaptor protein n=1 Tax=Roseovarius sp. TaxID=1486281 RepID=UPI0026208029|nr:head-tail adaptor protein [Roseovarius sp.]